MRPAAIVFYHYLAQTRAADQPRRARHDAPACETHRSRHPAAGHPAAVRRVLTALGARTSA